MKIKTINDPNEIIEAYAQNSPNAILLINIDKCCFVPEYIIAKLFNNNPALRISIIKNICKTSFKCENRLIATKKNFNNFLNKSKDLFKKIYYVTKRDKSEFEKIKSDLSYNNCSIEHEIINPDQIPKLCGNRMAYIDSDDSTIRSFEQSENDLIFFKLNLFA